MQVAALFWWHFPNHGPPLTVLIGALVAFLPALSTSHTVLEKTNRLPALIWYCQAMHSLGYSDGFFWPNHRFKMYLLPIIILPLHTVRVTNVRQSMIQDY